MVDENDPSAQAFTLEFDFGDEGHCFGALADTMAEHPQAKEYLDLLAVDQLTPDDLRTQVNDALEEVQEQVDEESADEPLSAAALLEDLQRLAAELEPHRGCICASDVWACTREWFDQELADVSVAGLRWLLRDSSGQIIDITEEAPSVSEWWSKLNRRDGWDSVKIEWNPATETLSAAYGSYPSMWHGTAQRLDAADSALYQELIELAGHWDTAASVATLLDNPRPVLHVAANLVRAASDRDEDLDLCDLVEVCAAAMRGLQPDQCAAAVDLAQSWTADVAGLLTVATAITASAA